jgi:hypothetical protein
MVLRHVKDVVVFKFVIDVVSVGKLGGVGGSSGTGASELGLEAHRVSLGFTTLVKSEDLVSDHVGTTDQRRGH